MSVRQRRRLTLMLALAIVSAACHRSVPAANDDDYRFASAGRSVSLTATPGGQRLAWPTGVGSWDTAIVGVRVRASATDPRVSIEAGGVRVDQYLDDGANGLRWLNLTGLKSGIRDGATISLTGQGVEIDSGGATLRVFDNRLDLAGPILILAPHPDDAEIAAFGLYANSNAFIVTITAGNAGDPLYAELVPDPAKQYALKGYLRAVDSVTVPWQGGIRPDHTYNLGYFDARLHEMHDDPGRVFSEVYGANTDVVPYRKANLSSLLPNGTRLSSWNNLIDDLAAILKQIQPSLIVMPFPQLDEHPDHKFTAVALTQAMATWPGNPRFLLYTNHAAGTRELYPYGPAGVACSLPPHDASLRLMGVYAHPVSEELQTRKLLALESMHDLRLTPLEQTALNKAVVNPLKRDSYPREPRYDYLRRAVRPQVIFYVFDRPAVESTIADFLRPPGKH